MGHSYQRARRAIRRGVLIGVFLIVWLSALLALRHAATQVFAHKELAVRVEQLEQQYDQELVDYAQLLVEIDRIANDSATQIMMLKNEFGYTQHNETPIVILRGN